MFVCFLTRTTDRNRRTFQRFLLPPLSGSPSLIAQMMASLVRKATDYDTVRMHFRANTAPRPPHGAPKLILWVQASILTNSFVYCRGLDSL
jgi:hypothetical protein